MTKAAEKAAEPRLDEDDLIHRAIREMQERKWFQSLFGEHRDATGRAFGDAISATVKDIRDLRMERDQHQREMQKLDYNIDRAREELAVLLDAIPIREVTE